jgi:hypothetical protein
MTRPRAFVTAALATAAINVLVASVMGFASPQESALIEPLKPHHSATLYQLSPIPAGADWGRSE